MKNAMAGITAAATVAAAALTCSPAQAVPVLPSTDPTPTVVKQVKVDVDGDGKADRVVLTQLDSTRFELTVTTAKTSSTVAFTYDAILDESRESAWFGAAKVDGVKGAEIIVHVTNPETSGDLIVYTWRKGALVAEKAPAAPTRSGWWISDLHGFRFFSSHGRVYVDAAQLNAPGTKGWVVRSVWRKGKWVKIAKFTKSSRSGLARYAGFNVASLLTGQASADIDGDGKLDLVTERVLRLDTYVWKVTTAKGKVATHTWGPKTDGGGLEGIATVDGVPGAELIFIGDGDGYTYKILTWRKGKLVTAPNVVGGSKWGRHDDGSANSYDFATVDGQWQVTINYWGEWPTVEFNRYGWTAGRWAKLNSWTQDLDDAAKAALCHGFCGVTMVKL